MALTLVPRRPPNGQYSPTKAKKKLGSKNCPWKYFEENYFSDVFCDRKIFKGFLNKQKSEHK